MERNSQQRALFMALNDDLRFALRGGLSWDEAIETLKDKVAQLERLRDRGCDPMALGWSIL